MNSKLLSRLLGQNPPHFVVLLYSFPRSQDFDLFDFLKIYLKVLNVLILDLRISLFEF